ncbi:MAG: glycosyltransferase family 4 protein [Bacteroidetes bacterium]|nr:glycosyltransferase family 4 protein [Bacteroidota bacterium]
MIKKKILIFIDWYLPGYKAGGPIQSIANLVEHLKNEFEFSIVTRDTDYCETEPYKGIKSNEWNILHDGTRVYYFSADQLNRTGIRNIIRKENFDCVYLNGIYSVYFTLYPLFFLRKKRNKRIVIATRGMLSKGSLSVKSNKKSFFLRAAKVLRLFDKVLFHATTKPEKEDIYQIFGKEIQIKIAANLPQNTRNFIWKEKKKQPETLNLVNIARISPEKNLLFALKILQKIKAVVTFDIYGPIYHSAYWGQCQALIKQMPPHIKVNYKDSLEPQKVLSELENYHIMFMPSTGENFGHVILQSLSVGCPVIISDQTPWKHLKEKNIGWDISLHHPENFVKAIEQYSKMDQAEYNALSKSAFDFALNYSSNPEIIEHNKQLFV